MAKGKKKFKRRMNPRRKARFLEYRTSNRGRENKIRRNVKRIYGLVLARSPMGVALNLRTNLKSAIKLAVISALNGNRLGSAFTADVLDKLAGSV